MIDVIQRLLRPLSLCFFLLIFCTENNDEYPYGLAIPCLCTNEYDHFCGYNNKTCGNPCLATCSGTNDFTLGVSLGKYSNCITPLCSSPISYQRHIDCRILSILQRVSHLFVADHLSVTNRGIRKRIHHLASNSSSSLR